MKFQAAINIMPKKEILDPQGKAVSGSMKNIGLPEVENVRIGKHITFQLSASSAEDAQQKAETACSKLLANVIMEEFEVVISPL